MTLQNRSIWVCLGCLAWLGLSGQAFAQKFQNQSSHGNAGLFVGIETFGNDTGIKSLDFSVESAIEMAHLFVIEMRLIPAENCYLCLSNLPQADSKHDHMLSRLKAQVENESQGRRQLSVRSATKADIVTNLKQAAVKGESHGQNVLVCYFTTHGFEEGNVPYLVPSDGNSDPFFRANAALDFNLVQQFIAKQSKAGHKLVFCDACREVKQYGVKSLDHRILGRPLDRKAFEAFSKPTPGIYKVLSCDRDQKSYEDPELQHGVFTYYLMKAIREEHPDQDQEGVLEVTLGTVVNRAKADVEAWSKRTSQQENKDYRQSPQVFVEDDAAKAKFEKLPLSRYVAVWSSLNWLDTITNHPNFKTNKPDLWNEAKSILNDFQQSNAYHTRVAEVVAEGITVNNLRYFEFQMDQAMKAKPIYEKQVSKLVHAKQTAAPFPEMNKLPVSPASASDTLSSSGAAGLQIEANTEGELVVNQSQEIVIVVENRSKADAIGVTLVVHLPEGLTHEKGRHLEMQLGTVAGSATRRIALNLIGLAPGNHQFSIKAASNGTQGPEVPVAVTVTGSSNSPVAAKTAQWLQQFLDDENSGIEEHRRDLYAKAIGRLRNYDERCPHQNLILEAGQTLEMSVSTAGEYVVKTQKAYANAGIDDGNYTLQDALFGFRSSFEAKVCRHLVLSEIKELVVSESNSIANTKALQSTNELLRDPPTGNITFKEWDAYTSRIHECLHACAASARFGELGLQLAKLRFRLIELPFRNLSTEQQIDQLRQLESDATLLADQPERTELISEIALSQLESKPHNLPASHWKDNPLPFADEFRAWLEKYPNVASSPEVAFRLAWQESAQHGMEQAIPHFEHLMKTYPESSYAETAARWIQEHREKHPEPQATNASSQSIQPKEIKQSSIEDDFLNRLGL